LRGGCVHDTTEHAARIVDELDKQGLADNTIIIFYSDNGGNEHSNVPGSAKTEAAEKNKSEFLADWRKWAGDQPPTLNTPLREGKGTLYEGGTRVPLMWAWAGKIKPATLSDAIVGPIDVYPTVIDLLGIAKPEQQKIDGVSYAKVLKSEGELTRTAYFNYHPHAGANKAGGVWVRSGDFKGDLRPQRWIEKHQAEHLPFSGLGGQRAGFLADGRVDDRVQIGVGPIRQACKMNKFIG
jgi:arylsulfatase A-like enzyme